VVGFDGGMVVTSVNNYSAKEVVLGGVVIILRCLHACAPQATCFFFRLSVCQSIDEYSQYLMRDLMLTIVELSHQIFEK